VQLLKLQFSDYYLRFLLAQLHMDSMANKATRNEIRKALIDPPKGLDNAYEEAIQRIKSQNDDDRKRAEQVLYWISYALRPLTVVELQHALAVTPSGKLLDKDDLTDEEILVSVCAGLVIIDQESNIIRLVHYTTHQFLERIRLNWFPTAQMEIARTCLTYLSFDIFGEGPCPSDKDMEIRLKENPLLRYAAQHWGHHARGDPETNQTVKTLALKFLEHNLKVMCSIQVMYLPKDGQYILMLP
jgi:hypothetical protein